MVYIWQTFSGKVGDISAQAACYLGTYGIFIYIKHYMEQSLTCFTCHQEKKRQGTNWYIATNTHNNFCLETSEIFGSHLSILHSGSK